MNKEHTISDRLFEEAQLHFAKGENWIAYNSFDYFLDNSNMFFFRSADEAHEFSDNNIREYDNYLVTYADSIDELLRRIPYGEELENTLSNKNLSIMNEKNLEYLKDNIKYMGFGEKHYDALEQHLKEGKDSFQLKISTEINKKPFEAVLNFRKSDNSDMYFFNNYQATLERTNGEKIDQTFYLSKGKGVTAKEAYNLLEGRPVFKELTNKAGEPYKAWIQLDFAAKDKHNNFEVKQYHENYGYDLKAAVGKFPVAEMDGAEREQSLIQSLKKGNIQSVSLEKEGNTSKVFLEANPQFKTVTIYNDKMQRLTQDQRNELSIVPKHDKKKEEKLEVKQDSKKTTSQKVAENPVKSRKKSTGKKHSV